ncbi:phosphoesterase [Pyrolobus fumarii 1A]|uniref:Phosphoesterase n=1 Tax=Pyrolobus fumarii (strain DSM 11204 / 1A) TaxID=694429 RepID=G0EH87_PYRF1|nr:phosphoesterase [Pyrolobus fumarii 1A]
MPGIEPVAEHPAVYIRSLRALVFADLHLGFEEEAAKHGYFLPRVQLKRALKMLEEAFSLYDPDRVIIVGDVKHTFERLTRLEREEVAKLFEYLKQKGVEVKIVKGNHDSYLVVVAKDYDVEVVKGHLEIDGIVFIHGHKQLPEGVKPRIIIMGHEHPSISLKDKVGYVAKAPCFLVGRHEPTGATLIVLPATGVYQTGTTVSTMPETYLSPILRKEVDLHKMKPFVIAEGLGVLEFPELGELEEILAPEEAGGLLGWAGSQRSHLG